MISKLALNVAAICAVGLFLGCATNTVEPAPATSTTTSGTTVPPPSSTQPAAAPAGKTATAPSKPGAKTTTASTPMAKVTTRQYVIPSGTVITVRLNDTLASNVSQSGQTFTATVIDPIQVDQKTVIAQGATATGTVVEAQALGRVEGGARLQLRLDSVDANGHTAHITTALIDRTEKGKGKRSAGMIGGGAAAGAVIGALAGGGKGAAIGAGAGAGAGTAGAVLTGNKNIVLPSESALSFKLIAPVEITN